jgi:uncharacterized protein with von Willebrand factor type A (vWA) domain
MNGEAGDSVSIMPGAFSKLHRNVLVFGRTLRALGFRVQPERMVMLAQAFDRVGFGDRDDVRSAARAILVRSKDDIGRFEIAFDAFWRAHGRTRADGADDGDALDGAIRDCDEAVDREGPSEAGDPLRLPAAGSAREPRIDDGGPRPPDARGARLDGDRSFTYSFAEGLYAKDFSQMSSTELERARDLTRPGAWDLGRRRTRRTVSGAGAGDFDARRTLRASLRRGGEVLELRRRTRKTKRRDLVLLCDISGSMDRYSRLLLHFVHTVRHAVGSVEAFVFGTRITRVTRQLRHRDTQAALNEIAGSVVDWAGGTRIGDSLFHFNRTWARRVLGRGAIVIIISDGWDRGDVRLLAKEMRRLQRGAFRLIWLNPLLGSAGYRPQTIGMRAALPYVDDFLPANNLKSLVQLAELLQTVDHRRPLRRQGTPAVALVR